MRQWARHLGWIIFVLCGCSSDDSSSGGQASSTDAGDASSASAWGTGACGTCVKSACAAEIDDCEVDPACAGYLGCLFACDGAADGNVYASCQVACAGGSANAARDSLEACRTTGPGASCPACGEPPDAGQDAADAAPPNPLVNQSCQTSSEANVCWKCEDENCCETYATCKSNPDCDAFRDCMVACEDPSVAVCTEACVQQVPGGYDDFRRRMACVNILCDGECAGAADPCADCMNEACPSIIANCYEDKDCDLLTNCWGACTNDACREQCSTTYADGVPLMDAMLECASTVCVAHCG